MFDSCFRYFLEFYREHKLDTTRPYPGVMESLEEIRQCHPDVLMAVLTNKPARPSREICDGLGISPFLFANYGGDSFSTKKPEAEGLNKIIEEARQILLKRGAFAHAMPARQVVMIGDSHVDVAVGRACGTSTLGCSYGLAKESLLAAIPDCMVESPRDWPRVLGCPTGQSFSQSL